MMIRTHQAGFNLVELSLAVLVIGILTLIFAPLITEVVGAQRLAYAEKHRLNNQLIGVALMNYAANSTQYGRLPAPYTGGGYTKAVYNPGDTSQAGVALAQALTETGISPAEINDDATASYKVRVYQLVQGLQQQTPLYYQSGPLVTLTYDYGAIYLTQCPKATASCNPNGATGVPGDSAALTAVNYSTWNVSGTDGAAYFASSLPIQKQMLATTVQRADRVRDALLAYFRELQRITAAGDTTNHYPNQAGASAAGSLNGANPATNQGCRDGWYDLSSASVAVLPTVGLAREEFGVTAWGGRVEYCRDYDPTAAGSPDAPPHDAAIRLLANVSSGGPPDNAVPGNNIVLTF